eukprot:RCo049358
MAQPARRRLRRGLSREESQPRSRPVEVGNPGEPETEECFRCRSPEDPSRMDALQKYRYYITPGKVRRAQARARAVLEGDQGTPSAQGSGGAATSAEFQSWMAHGVPTVSHILVSPIVEARRGKLSDYFARTRSLIEALWIELDIPQPEQDKVKQAHFFPERVGNYRHINTEIQRLTARRDQRAQLIRLIEQREAVVAEILSVSKAVNLQDGSVRQKLVVTSLVDLLLGMRRLTCRIVKDIVALRESERPARPFIWRGQNYMLKIREDLRPLEGSALGQALACTFQNNPFVLPGRGMSASRGLTANQLIKERASLEVGAYTPKRPAFDAFSIPNSPNFDCNQLLGDDAHQLRDWALQRTSALSQAYETRASVENDVPSAPDISPADFARGRMSAADFSPRGFTTPFPERKLGSMMMMRPNSTLPVGRPRGSQVKTSLQNSAEYPPSSFPPKSHEAQQCHVREFLRSALSAEQRRGAGISMLGTDRSSSGRSKPFPNFGSELRLRQDNGDIPFLSHISVSAGPDLAEMLLSEGIIFCEEEFLHSQGVYDRQVSAASKIQAFYRRYSRRVHCVARTRRIQKERVAKAWIALCNSLVNPNTYSQ